MHELDDLALLREYAACHSEAAFEELVSRRVGFVYSAALRQARDPQLAEEITQAVFVILAQKAGRIPDKAILTGWLFNTTRFVALAQLRAAALRRHREQQIQRHADIMNVPTEPTWDLIAPLLDEALIQLGEKDRQVVLLHFFDKKPFAEIGGSLGMSEVSARKRASRALEKLRVYLSRRGAVSSGTVIAGMISANSIQAAPVALAKAASAVAFTQGATASGSTLTLIKGALKIMAWTKAKTAIVAGVVVVLTAGTTTTLVIRHQHQQQAAIGHSVKGQAVTRLGDLNPAKLAALEQMKTIKMTVIPAIMKYAEEHDDDIPNSMAALQPYLPADAVGMDDENWMIVATGKFTPQLTQHDQVLLQQRQVPKGQYNNMKIVGYTDGHIAAMK